MKPTNKQEQEILQVYDTWLNSYLNGDVKTYDSFLDVDYRFIGSTNNEEFLNKKDTTNFFKATADQLAGKTEIRNSIKTVEQLDGLIFITDLFDAYFLNGDDWAYYGRFRFTSAMRKNKNGWRFMYQHFSTPDAKAQEGETLGTEQITKENQDLRDAIKRRTVELEQKNRELQIEAALERVRARTMAMQKSDELKEVIQVVYDQFVHLNINIEHTGFILDYKARDDMHIWLADRHEVPSEVTIPYFDCAHWNSFNEAKEKGMDFFANQLDFEEKNRFYHDLFKLIPGVPEETLEYYFSCPGLAISTVLLENVGLYIENFSGIPYTDEENNTLMRFGKVFQQTYTRFLDLQKAEAQAREAQINLAVERVRAKALAMHKSEEIIEVVAKLKDEVMDLDIPDVIAATIFLKEGDDKVRMWDLSSIEKNDEGYQTHLDITFKLKKTDPHLYVKRVWENPDNYFIEIQEGKDFKRIIAWLRENNKTQIADEVEEFIEKTKLKRLYHTTKKLNNGKLCIDLMDPPSDEMESILTKMGAAFDLAYKRFEDLKKAEAQARESEIQLALERVRAKALAMRSSNELVDVSLVLREQMAAIGQDQLETIAIHFIPKDSSQFSAWFAFHPPDKDGSQIKFGAVDFSKTETYYARKFIQLYNSDQSDYLIEASGKYLDEWQDMLMDHVPVFKELWKNDVPSLQYWYFSDFSGGNLMLITLKEAASEALELLRRSAQVFDLAYRRFLDLQKAEAQTRESQIEAAMERIRSRAIAMRTSNELLEVALEIRIQTDLLGQQDLELSVVHLYEKDAEYFESLAAMRTPGSEGEITTHKMMFPVDATPEIQQMMKNYWAGLSQYTIELNLEQREAWQKVLETTVPDLFDQRLQFDEDEIAAEKKEYWNFTDFSGGSLLTVTYSPPTTETKELFRRAADVFDLAYRRYGDLKKAEAQAREAQIENALEKVRSRTMAMHKSEELAETALVLYEQFAILGNIPDRISIGIFKEETKEIELWGTDQSGSQLNQRFSGSWEKSAVMTKLYKAWKSGNDFFVADLSGQNLKVWLKYIREEMKLFVDGSHIKGRRVQQAAFFSHGMLLSTTNEPIAEEIIQLLIRFARVFSQTYTRFLDLQKAESQAREAQIEGALERLRSKTMAMHNSKDLEDIVVSLFDEVLNLGLDKSIRCGIGILEGHEGMETRSVNSNSDGSVDLRVGMLNMTIHPMLKGLKKAWKNGSKGYSYEYTGKDVRKYYEALNNEPEYPFNADLATLPKQEFHRSFFFSSGIIFAFSESPISEESSKILARFAAVFGQTYRRFLDLQKAEAQAREATRQASLDRVRGQIASMRSTDDLNRITPLVWNELTTMGVPFIRCGVFIIDEPTEIVQAYLSAPDGHSLGVLHLRFNANPLTENTVAHWREGNIFKEHWNREEFISWTQSLMEQGQISDKNTYQGVANPPESLNLHFIPFTQGMLYVGSENPLNDEQIELVQSLADAFAIAYARYEDFTKLEKAKQSVETTLSELKVTQNQLIQSEKMASLGELTAGIAHEIQNPLNFVNNFSEVSGELVIEMNEEIDLGNFEEAKEIATDLKQNLEKINHHGKRAGEIVKGMLQHSRTSSGKKELTDINALADEYLRLAYHGLRAKDKSFNAKMESEFDPDIPKIEVIPQDIGRVILNLITNAFYVVNEKKKQQLEGYEPKVSVSTKKINGKIEIKVEDNGNGIPKEVKEKIFQPFFTTKPTGQGTGLGLSLSYDIVKAHGGELKVETKEGEGTTFTIVLPMS